MTALLYIIFICNSGGACAQANDATFSSPQDCIQELPKLYDGTLAKSGRFYARNLSRDTWLECVSAREDDGRIVASFNAAGHRLPPPSMTHAITQSFADANRSLQQSLIELSH